MTSDRIFFFALLSLALGIAAGSFFSLPYAVAFFLSLAFIISAQSVFRNTKILIGALFCLALLGGAHLSSEQVNTFQVLPPSLSVAGEVRVLGQTEEKNFYQEVRLHFEQCEKEPCPRQNILWQAPKILELSPGTKLFLSCSLERPQNFDPAFDYRMFLAKENVGYLCKRATSAEILPDDLQTRASTSFYLPKVSLENALSKAVSEPEAGLAKGLLLGGNAELALSLKEAFKRAGLSHIVAVSGYNITLIAQGFLILGLAIGLWRKQALLVAALGIVLFILMIGAPASAVRAGIMALFGFFAMQTGRLSQSLNGLLFAAGLMLIHNPLLLRFDIGFQLSFLATLAIILTSPWQQEFLARDFFGKSVVQIALLTLSVEIFVVPLLLLHFGTFSAVSLVANVLLLPLVPWVMGLTFAGALVFLVLPGFEILFLWPAYLVLAYMIRMAEFLSALPWASVSVSSWNLAFTVLWYCLLFSAIVLWQRKRNTFNTYGEEV